MSLPYTLTESHKLFMKKIYKDLNIENKPGCGLLNVFDYLSKLKDELGDLSDSNFRKMIIATLELRMSYEFIFNKIKYEFFIKFDTESYREDSEFKHIHRKDKNYNDMLDYIDFLRSEFEEKYKKEYKQYIEFHKLSNELGFCNLQFILE